EKYDILTLPVVDKENRLVGIVTVDDAIDVIQEEATEDIEKMAAITPSDHSYFKTSVFETFKARIPWLLLLMVSATFTGAIISGFEDKLTGIAALIAFIPMLMDTGGNSGGQSSVTVIRAISLGDIEFSDILRVIWKELRVAFLCSGVLAVVNGLKLYVVDYLILSTFDGLGLAKAMLVMLTVCVTLFFTVIVAKLVGCTLPILAKKIGFDPAVMASPFITTIVDAISLLIYIFVASRILGI
ncbi:MAG: magnesium transporter, partial [Clostridia bacterium]|nr:magnesium transporter [Clostridia bacterium]